MKNNLLFILLFASTFIFSQHINTRFISVDKGATEKFERGVSSKTKTFNSKEGEIRYLTPLNIDTNTQKKYCRFKRSGIKHIDYKDPDFLS